MTPRGRDGAGRAGGRSLGRGRGARGGRGRGRGTALPRIFTEGRTGKGGGGRAQRGGGGAQRGGRRDRGGRGRSSRDDESGGGADAPGSHTPDASQKRGLSKVFEDEEIDEDEAFNSSDEERYGDVLRSISARGKAAAGSDGTADSGEESEGSDEDERGTEVEEGAEEGGVLLSDLFESAVATEIAQPNAGVSAEQCVASDNDADGESGENSDDGRSDGEGNDAYGTGGKAGPKGGGGSSSGDSNNDDGSSEADDGDDEEDDGEGEGGGGHERLLGFVDALARQDARRQQLRAESSASQQQPESRFGPAGVEGGGGILTLQDLMSSLSDTRGFGNVRRQMEGLSGAAAPAAPAAAAVVARAERQAVYAASAAEMARWQAPVQAARRAEVINLAPRDRSGNLTSAALVGKFEPTTALERNVAALLAAGGAASEPALLTAEQEELKGRSYTAEEVRQRQAELQRMRALLFYHERKRHYLNKIKSKAYRRVRKRQRIRVAQQEETRLRETDPRLAAELEEKEAQQRAEERLTLRHKNTSKWVKKALRRGKQIDPSTRAAVSEQLQLGQELMRKAEGGSRSGCGGSSGGGGGDVSDSDSGSSWDSDGSGGSSSDASGGRATRRAAGLSRRDATNLAALGSDNDADLAGAEEVGGVFKMKFMQRAIAAQREKAKREAAELLQELQADREEEDGGGDCNDDGSGDGIAVGGGGGGGGGGDGGRADGAEGAAAAPADAGKPSTAEVRAAKAAKVAAEAAAKAAVAESMPEGALLSEAVSMDARMRSRVVGTIAVDLEGIETACDLEAAAAAAAAVEVERGESGLSPNAAAVAPAQYGGAGVAAAGAATKAAGSQERAKGEGKSGKNGYHGGKDKSAAPENPWLSAAGVGASASVPPSREKKAKRGFNAEVHLDLNKAAASMLPAVNCGRRGAPLTERRGEDGASSGNGGGGGGSSSCHNAAKAVANGMGGTTPGKTGASGAKDNVHDAGDTAAADDAAAAGGAGFHDPDDSDRNSDDDGGSAAEMGNKDGRRITQLSQAELIARAFAAPDLEAEFLAEKELEADSEAAKGRAKGARDAAASAGWGSWTGMGTVAPRPNKRQREDEERAAEAADAAKRARKDSRLPAVMLNERRQKRSAKFKIAEVPYPFTSSEQYERAMRQPIGPDWNTVPSVKAMTRRSVVTRPGHIIQPLKLAKEKKGGRDGPGEDKEPPRYGAKVGGGHGDGSGGGGGSSRGSSAGSGRGRGGRGGERGGGRGGGRGGKQQAREPMATAERVSYPPQNQAQPAFIVYQAAPRPTHHGGGGPGDARCCYQLEPTDPVSVHMARRWAMSLVSMELFILVFLLGYPLVGFIAAFVVFVSSCIVACCSKSHGSLRGHGIACSFGAPLHVMAVIISAAWWDTWSWFFLIPNAFAAIFCIFGAKTAFAASRDVIEQVTTYDMRPRVVNGGEYTVTYPGGIEMATVGHIPAASMPPGMVAVAYIQPSSVAQPAPGVAAGAGRPMKEGVLM